MYHRNTLRATRSETTGARRAEVTLWLQENSRSTHSGLQCLSLVLNLCNNVVWSLIKAKNLMFGPSILNPTRLGDPQQLPLFSGLLLHLLKGRGDWIRSSTCVPQRSRIPARGASTFVHATLLTH